MVRGSNFVMFVGCLGVDLEYWWLLCGGFVVQMCLVINMYWKDCDG